MKFIDQKRIVLRNGLPCYIGVTEQSASFEISMHINSGSRDENEINNGVSHFLEHMMFRGSHKFPNSIELAAAMEDLGGESNAVTSAESTVYWIRGSSKKLHQAINIFAEFILNPNYADLELERSIILQELHNDYNEDGELIDVESLAMRALFPNHPLGLPIIGTENTIRALSIEQLEEKRRQFYTPNKCALSFISSLEVQKVLPIIESSFGHPWDHAKDNFIQTSYVKLDEFFEPSLLPHQSPFRRTKTEFCLQNNPDNQFAVRFMFPCAGGMNRDVVADTFLQRILDDGISSRLPSVIREKNGLVYDVSADSNAFADIGVFAVDATVSKDSVDELITRLWQELDTLANCAPSQAEMDRIKFRYHYDLETLPESHSRFLTREIWNDFNNSNLSIQDEMDIVESFTAEDVRCAAEKIFSAKRRSVVLVGPRARKKRDLLEKLFNRF